MQRDSSRDSSKERQLTEDFQLRRNSSENTDSSRKTVHKRQFTRESSKERQLREDKQFRRNSSERERQIRRVTVEKNDSSGETIEGRQTELIKYRQKRSTETLRIVSQNRP